jgi:hypothetical protein
MQLHKIFDYEADIIPEVGFDLGNASTKVYSGVLFRWGESIANDYGTYPIDNTNYSKIPLSPHQKIKKGWNWYLNFGLKGNLIAHNIFLDGNTNVQSHSVEKKNFTLQGSYGISFSYNNMCFDYIRTHTTKEFTTQQDYLSYGSWSFRYNF